MAAKVLATLRIMVAVSATAVCAEASTLPVIALPDGHPSFRAEGPQCYDGKAGGTLMNCDLLEVRDIQPQARPWTTPFIRSKMFGHIRPRARPCTPVRDGQSMYCPRFTMEQLAWLLGQDQLSSGFSTAPTPDQIGASIRRNDRVGGRGITPTVPALFPTGSSRTGSRSGGSEIGVETPSLIDDEQSREGDNGTSDEFPRTDNTPSPSAVPLPASWLLLLGAVAGLVRIRKR